MNLLPAKEKEGLRKGLKLRSLILGSFIVSVSFLTGLVMLAPSYFLIKGNISNVVSENYSSKTKDEAEDVKILDLPAEINSKLQFLQSNSSNATAADSVSKVMKYLSEGIKLNSVYFKKGQTYKEKQGVSILISGIALDRNSLMLFSTSLKGSNLFSSVDIPVSNLTKDKNLPFSINIFIENNK